MIALTRPVPLSLGRCELTHLGREPIDVARARDEHAVYEGVLASLGVEIVRVAQADNHPDSVFIEDTAIVLDEVAILARPGANSRRREVEGVGDALVDRRPLRRIEHPGTIDGGDVIVSGRTIFVGRSTRTNDAGIEQLRRIAGEYDYNVVARVFSGCLHLKTAVTLIGDDALLYNPDWIPFEQLPFPGSDETLIPVHPDEAFAANALRIADTLLHGAQFPRTRERLEDAGFRVTPVAMRELAKAEAGITCCSLILRSQERRAGAAVESHC